MTRLHPVAWSAGYKPALPSTRWGQAPALGTQGLLPAGGREPVPRKRKRPAATRVTHGPTGIGWTCRLLQPRQALLTPRTSSSDQRDDSNPGRNKRLRKLGRAYAGLKTGMSVRCCHRQCQSASCRLFATLWPAGTGESENEDDASAQAKVRPWGTGTYSRVLDFEHSASAAAEGVAPESRK